MPTFALAGAGPAAALWGQAVPHVPGHRVAVVASRTPTNAARLATELRAETCRFEDLPAGAEIVVVASPPQLHADHALAAVRAGAAVIVERPLAVTLADADRLVAAADAGARVAYAEHLLFSPYVRDAVHRIRGMGPLAHLDARVVQARPPRPADGAPARGGGVLLEVGASVLAVVFAALGADRPVAVAATLELGSDGVDDRSVVTLTLASGARARMDLSWREDDRPSWDLQVATPSSALRLELLPQPHVEQLGVDLPHPAVRFRDAAPQLEQYGYLDQVVETTGELLDGRAPYLDARFGRFVLEALCAAYRSGRTGVAEPLPFGGPRDRTPLELWIDG